MRNLRLLAGGLSLAGLGVSLYLTSVHYHLAPLACSRAGTINCDAVLSSPWSSWFGVPTALFGAVWFGLFLLAILFFPARHGLLRLLAWSGAGVVAFLVYLEVFRIGALCLWCSTAHVLVLSLLVLVEGFWPANPARQGGRP